MQNGEKNVPGLYMSRKRFYVPKKEISRYYGRIGDADPNNFFFDCDYEDEDDFDVW